MEEKLKCGRKRPEMVYYRPGMMSKLNKKYYTYPDNNKHQFDSDVAGDSTGFKSMHKYAKKPDKQVYVAKGRGVDEKKEMEKPKEFERRDPYESIPDFVFENSRLSKAEEEHKDHRASHSNTVERFQRKPKLPPETSSHIKKTKSTTEDSYVASVAEETKNLSLDPPLPSGPPSHPPKVSGNESTNQNTYAESSEKSDVRPKPFKQPHYPPGKAKKYSNKPEHYKFEQNLPPRLQRKLMEKVNQMQPQQREAETSRHQPQVEPQINNVNRGGIIRLPPSSPAVVATMSTSSTYGKQNYLCQQENTHASFDNMRPRQYGIVAPRQLFNPYHTNKPCVVIRPTYQTVMSHSSSRPTMSVADIQIPSPNTDVTSIHQWAHSYFHDQQHISTSNSLPIHNYQYPLVPSYGTGVAGILQLPKETMSSFESSTLGRKKLKPVVEKNMKEVMNFEKDLQIHLSRGAEADERLINQIRWKIQLRYEHVILTDPKFCAENNVEQMLWKSVYYQFIEMHRREIEENNREDSKEKLNKLIEEATTFFENLLVNLQEKFEFSVDQYIEHEYDPEMPNYDVIKLVAISAQKIYLYLGDIARYKEQASNTSNFGKARSCYLKAQQLAPKNGRPYNQLALLAMYGKRKLDAVYYYMRSLAASNPFHSARENLLGIFDEVRRKYENAEQKRLEEQKTKKASLFSEEGALSALNEERLEIWIRPDGTSSKLTNTVESSSIEDELSDVDLNKRFVLSFLHVHGKLFTKVGMDTFTPTVTRMLSELRSLLKRRPLPISSQRLLQLMAISMFSVYHTSLKSESHNGGGRSLLQTQAIQVTLATISALIERANVLLQEHLHKGNQKNFISDEVAELLPPIKIWTDWMSCQKHVWSPPPPNFDFGVNKGDVWTPFSELLTSLMSVELRSVKLLPTKFDGCEAVILPEDITLSGFIPLLGAPQSSSYIQPPYDKEKARACLRINRIQFFGDYLCGIPDPYLEFNVKRKRYVSLVPSLCSEDSEKIQPINFDLSDNEAEDIPTDSSSLENVNIVSDEKSPKQKEIQQLWSRQEELKRAQMKEEKIRQHLNAYLREEKKTRMVIQPRFLIPDTNCFIDHLNKLQCLIESKFYEVIIPLVVINELNGLTARGSDSLAGIPFRKSESFSTDLEHQKRVGQLARKALDYLEKSFNEKSYQLKAITSKGSILDNINFRNESSEAEDTTNDDLVLACCLQFIKERPTEQNPQESGQVITIFRETVLLTEDRNLRVKALSQNVPVKSLPVFLQWANIP